MTERTVPPVTYGIMGSMKIIFCRWNSICENGVTNAFAKLKIPTVYLDRRFTHVDYDKSYVEALSKVLQDNPDSAMVFSINFIPIIARVCKAFNIIYVSWIVDSPCFQLYSKTLEYDTNRVFLFDRAQFDKFSAKNPKGIFHFPLGTDVDEWDGITLNREDHQRYDCDVSFVGSLYSEKIAYNRDCDKLSEHTRGYCEGLIAAQMQVMGYSLLDDAVTEEFACKFKDEVKYPPLGDDYDEDVQGIVADTYLGEKCTEQDRICTLNAIGEKFSLDLYTLSDTAPLNKNIHCRGGADSSTMMPKIIKCSKINLNMTNKPIKTGLPLRIFDIMGMGGFLISNYQQEIPEIFTPGEDIVLYESIPDLLELIEYYLEHDDERRTIAYNGYMKVKNEYTYTARIVKMLQIILDAANES